MLVSFPWLPHARAGVKASLALTPARACGSHGKLTSMPSESGVLRARIRRVHYLHQDGFILTAVLRALSEREVLPHLAGASWHPVGELASATHSSEGPL